MVTDYTSELDITTDDVVFLLTFILHHMSKNAFSYKQYDHGNI